MAEADPPGICRIELRPRGGHIEVWRHRVEDMGDEDWLDIYELPALDRQTSESLTSIQSALADAAGMLS